MAHIVFIGLGNMGRPMAANLQKAQHSITGFDLSAEARAAAAEAGLKVASTEDGLFAGADVVITMLPSGTAVREVWARAVPQMARGALMIDSSTIDVTSSRAAHDLAAAAGLLSLDAPVSGGTEGATAGTLTFMAGGTDEAFATGQPLLAAMGRRIVHCGGPGNGEVAKICNNMILGISMIAVSEAFNLAESLGLSHQALFEVASTSSGQCYALTTHCPVPGPVPTASANRGYTPGFATELMAKDLRLSQEAADASGSRTPLGAAAEEIFGRYATNGGRGRDYSAVISYLKTL